MKRYMVYVVLSDSPGTGRVFGTVVSRPSDIHRDAPRLFGKGVGWVSWSAAGSGLKRLAKAADRAGLPIARPLHVGGRRA